MNKNKHSATPAMVYTVTENMPDDRAALEVSPADVPVHWHVTL